MADKKQTVDLGLLEEDDEFEEFPAEGKYKKPHIYIPTYIEASYSRLEENACFHYFPRTMGKWRLLLILNEDS